MKIFGKLKPRRERQPGQVKWKGTLPACARKNISGAAIQIIFTAVIHCLSPDNGSNNSWEKYSRQHISVIRINENTAERTTQLRVILMQHRFLPRMFATSFSFSLAARLGKGISFTEEKDPKTKHVFSSIFVNDEGRAIFPEKKNPRGNWSKICA